MIRMPRENVHYVSLIHEPILILESPSGHKCCLHAFRFIVYEVTLKLACHFMHNGRSAAALLSNVSSCNGSMCCRHRDAAAKLVSDLFQGRPMPENGDELLASATTGLGVAAMLKRVMLKADVSPKSGTLTIHPEEAVKWLRLTRSVESRLSLLSPCILKALMASVVV